MHQRLPCPINTPCIAGAQLFGVLALACIVAAYRTPITPVPIKAGGQDIGSPMRITVHVIDGRFWNVILAKPEFIDLKKAVRFTMIACGVWIKTRFHFGNRQQR